MPTFCAATKIVTKPAHVAQLSLSKVTGEVNNKKANIMLASKLIKTVPVPVAVTPAVKTSAV